MDPDHLYIKNTFGQSETTLQIAQQVRDLVLFNLAIDSKLRGCDVVASSGRPYGRERPADRCVSS